jgi:alpha-tubulin suppressor-like RCC1 family protein
LATSNWTDLASCGFQAIALRSDGTLWSLFRAEHINKRWKVVEDQPRQIGSEGNWVRVAAGQSHLLVLKEDGTLWGWGGNSYSQVCEEGPDRLTNGPVRIGRDSDWTQVFARRDSSVGVKSDGSSWQWGRFYEFQGQRSGVRYENHNQPVRWGVDLGGVRKLIGEQPFDLLLHQDGTLWAVGQLFYGILGTSTQPHYASEPVEAGGNRLWLDITVAWSEIAGISEDGRLWKETQESRDRDPKTMSQHNDWIAVEGVFGQCIVALAADGTLSCWATDNGRGPLAPSRRPLTSINIFDEPK